MLERNLLGHLDPNWKQNIVANYYVVNSMYLSPIKEPPQNGLFDPPIRHSPTIKGNSPFDARDPPTILSHSNFRTKSSKN